MNSTQTLTHQVKFDLLIFRRNPASTFFTVIMPLIFLVIFTSIFGNETLDNGAKVATLYVPGILALAIISANTVNLAIVMTSRREQGVLKRVRGTPLPPWMFMASQAIAGFVISMLMMLIITGLGSLLYGVTLNLASVPSLLISVLLGAACFATLGLALTTVIPSEDAAPAFTNATLLPLYFISDVFVSGELIPDWLQTFASLFPVVHLSKALQESYNPFVEGTPWPWEHWLVLIAWTAFGLTITLKYFRWTPRR
jgi:ABC-2 type transport system permease protein